MRTNGAEPESGANARTSLKVFLLLILAGLLTTYAWTRWWLPFFNSEHLGGDACQHAIMVYCQSLQDPTERSAVAGILEDYPPLAHFLAAQVMPLFGNDPYKAMRAISFASILAFLMGQYCLFRIFCPPATAVLVLLLWQMLCCFGNVGNAQYYYIAYFYAQAVGMTALYPAVALITMPAAAPVNRVLLGLGASLLGVFAYLCHIVPGAALFGALGLYTLICFVRRPNRVEGLRLLMVVVLGLAVVVGTKHLAMMGRLRNAEGSAPLKNIFLLLTWLPVALVAAAAAWRNRAASPRNPWRHSVQGGLACLLASAGLLQAICAFEWLVLAKCSSYPAMKLFYILFPVSSLLCVVTLVDWLSGNRAIANWTQVLSRRFGSAGTRLTTANLSVALALLLCYLQMRPFVVNELRPDKGASPRSSPIQLAQQMQQLLRTEPSEKKTAQEEVLYYDPLFPNASVFVNVVGLHRPVGQTFEAVLSLLKWKPETEPVPESLKQQAHFVHLLMPQTPEEASQSSLGKH